MKILLLVGLLALAGCTGGGMTETSSGPVTAPTPPTAQDCISQDSLGCVPGCFRDATCEPNDPPTAEPVVSAPIENIYIGMPLVYNDEIPVYYAGDSGESNAVAGGFQMVNVTWPDGSTHACSTFWLKVAP